MVKVLMTTHETTHSPERAAYFRTKLTPYVRGQKAPSRYKTVRSSR